MGIYAAQLHVHPFFSLNRLADKLILIYLLADLVIFSPSNQSNKVEKEITTLDLPIKIKNLPQASPALPPLFNIPVDT